MMKDLFKTYCSRAVQPAGNKHAGRLVLGVILFFVLGWVVQDTFVGTTFIGTTFIGTAFGDAGSVSDGEKEIAETVQTLKEMEQQAPPNIAAIVKERQADKLEGEAGVYTNASPAVSDEQVDENDEKKEQDLIMSMDNPDISVFNQWFEGCAVLGDSIAESAGEFGFLNPSILFAEIGCAVVDTGELVESMVQMYPQKIFISLGLNDLERYGANVDRFIENYRNLVMNIRESLPDTKIYVVAILPLQQKAIDKEPARANAELYNEKLEELCQEMNLDYIDSGFILERDSSFYEPDGIHPVSSFYYKWLTYLADVAGISG